MYIIRNVKERDHIYLQKLAKECKPLDVHTSYTYWLNSTYNQNCSFILEVDDIIAGYIMSVEMPEIIFIWQIGIVPAYRHRGYSQKLIDKCVKYAEKTDKDIEITISKENTDSNQAFIKYCEKNGYRIKAVKECDIKNEQGDICEKETLFHIYIKTDLM